MLLSIVKSDKKGAGDAHYTADDAAKGGGGPHHAAPAIVPHEVPLLDDARAAMYAQIEPSLLPRGIVPLDDGLRFVSCPVRRGVREHMNVDEGVHEPGRRPPRSSVPIRALLDYEVVLMLSWQST